MRLCHYRWFWD